MEWEGNKNKTPNNQRVRFSLLVFQDTDETINDFSFMEGIRIFKVL